MAIERVRAYAALSEAVLGRPRSPSGAALSVNQPVLRIPCYRRSAALHTVYRLPSYLSTHGAGRRSGDHRRESRGSEGGQESA